MEPLVDVLMPVYNHEKYLKLAVEGVLSQKTSFKYRLLIGEDCSKDGSRAIVQQYAEQYPGIVVAALHERNLGATGNSLALIKLVKAKYIAMCEGDDYWTDPLKLQKQADFMEANPDFSMCFSDVDIVDEIGMQNPNCFPELQKDVFTIEDIINTGHSFIPTATLLFRNVLPDPLPSFYMNALSGDIAIHLLLADKGKAKHFAEKTAVYRQHSHGITKTDDCIENGDSKDLVLFVEANRYFNYKYDKMFKRRLSEMSRMMLIYGASKKKGRERIRHYFRKMPDYLKYSNGINFKELVYYHLILFFPSFLKLLKGR